MTDAQGRVKLTNIPGGWQLSHAIAAEFLP